MGLSSGYKIFWGHYNKMNRRQFLLGSTMLAIVGPQLPQVMSSGGVDLSPFVKHVELLPPGEYAVTIIDSLTVLNKQMVNFVFQWKIIDAPEAKV